MHNFRGSPTDGSRLLRLDVFQEADSYQSFTSRNLAVHNFECVFSSGTVYPRSISFRQLYFTNSYVTL